MNDEFDHMQTTYYAAMAMEDLGTVDNPIVTANEVIAWNAPLSTIRELASTLDEGIYHLTKRVKVDGKEGKYSRAIKDAIKDARKAE